MIVVCNGVYKSGSTWLFLMLLELFEQKQVPNEWKDENQDRNIDLLREPKQIFTAASSTNIAAKTHSYEEAFLRDVRQAGAKVIVTKRDHLQIIASHYHHFCNEKFRIPLRLYLLTIGLIKALEIKIYEDIATSPAAADLIIDYAEIRSDPAKVLAKVNDVLELGYPDTKILQVARSADMRGKNYSSNFSQMTDRQWFYKRSQGRPLTQRQSRAISATDAIAAKMMKISAVNSIFLRLLKNDRRRARYAEYTSKGGILLAEHARHSSGDCHYN